MKLEKIIVKGLFGVFNHEIVLKEHITILVSENGYGKTVILSMLYALLDKNIVFFYAVIFNEFILEFSDGKTLKLEKNKEKDIYLNGVFIFSGKDYEKQMTITINNAYDGDLPNNIDINDLLDCNAFLGFDHYKINYNQREFIEKGFIDKKEYPIIGKLLLSTHRVEHASQLFSYGFQVLDILYNNVPERPNNQFFIDIINSFLTNKILKIQSNKFIIISKITNKKIPLVNLSSGERHLLVMFHHILFSASENDFILLDEPEISLHISWQKKFISTLQEIVAFKPLNILIATHAPSVVGSHWDLVVELNEPTTV